MMPSLRRLGIEWTLAIGFLREGRAQSLMITVGVVVGVAVIVFIPALILGLQSNMIIVFVAISVAFGIASVLSVSVVQRTREIGILRATGATRQQILRVFLIQGAVFGLLGSVAGIAASYGLVWAFNAFGPGLFHIPVSRALVAWALLLAILTGVLAAAVPSRRAARLVPVVAIRFV